MKGDIVLDMVSHFNQYGVTFPSNDPRPWKLPVDCYYALCLTQSCHIF